MTERTTRLSACPECGAALNAAQGARVADGQLDDSLQPEAGDLTMCIHCTQVLRYSKDGLLEPFPDKEFRELPLDQRELFHSMRRLFQATD